MSTVMSCFVSQKPQNIVLYDTVQKTAIFAWKNTFTVINPLSEGQSGN